MAVKANQPIRRKEVEAGFAEAPAGTLDSFEHIDKVHGRIEQRAVAVLREVGWLGGQRRFPGELSLPKVAAIVRVPTSTELKDRCRKETRYSITSANLDAPLPSSAATWP